MPYNPSTYGDTIAPIYDRLYPDPEPGAVELLLELAGSRRVLELGIGTGRLALPLAEAGVEIEGLDISDLMIEMLRAKPGGTELTVHRADFRDFELQRRYGLVFIAFSTFLALLDQEHQIHCMECVAAHLEPGGRFLVEAFWPDPARFDRGQRVAAYAMTDDGVHVHFAIHDLVRQRVSARHLLMGTGGIECYPAELRYVWPSELDLMARLAGLALEARYGDWNKTPLTASSERFLSLYRRL
ncbi:MAG: trans-aconitate 2-methyltransferase [Vulcanimicrobiota bacterium]